MADGGLWVRLIGRHDMGDLAGPRFAWPGSAIEATFIGRRIAVRLRGSSDLFSVILDGKEQTTLVATPARELYPVVDGLVPGEHQLTLVKRTEPLVGETQLLGFELDEGGRLQVPVMGAARRRIEFIGDSVTAGFGVLGYDETCAFSPETEDFTVSFAALTARALDAEPVAVAWSGRGVVRNYADEPGEPMPVLYERTLPAHPDSRWDFRRWIADAVVVNLGTNDFSVGQCPSLPDFIDAYVGLLHRVRTVYPRVFLFCCLGPMLSGAELREARRAIMRAVDILHAEGAESVAFLEFPPHTRSEGYGCDGHPSARTHRRMSAQLTAAIRAALGW
jgi:hypothetical protein